MPGKGDDLEQDSSDDTVPPSSPEHSLCSQDRCPRTLRLEYYERDEATLQKKWKHTDWLDATYSSREERILSTVLAHESTVMELNPFPYVTPEGVQHWTLWGIDEMSPTEIEDFVCNWIQKNAPCANQWNYDENESRSIDLFHVHVYIEFPLASKRQHTLEENDEENSAKRCKRNPVVERRQCDDFRQVACVSLYNDLEVEC